MFASELLSHPAGYWGGQFRPATGGPRFDVVNPATGDVLASLPEYGATEAGLAIDAAQATLDRRPPIHERAVWLRRIAVSLADNKEELARIITAENGKPLAEAEGEVTYAAGFFRDAVKHLDKLRSHELVEQPRGHRWRVFHRPAGVAGLITPWNFPVAMLAKKLAGALAAGCPVVVKPSELTPLSCIAWFSLLHKLDLPPGMVNLVFGRAPEIGAVLCARPEVRVISFTGSTAVGRLLATQSAPTLKRMSMELGGNAPCVIFEDADLDPTIEHVMANKFRCAGQTCVCTNRVLVAASVYDRFARRLAERVSQLQVGPGDAPGTEVGPLINHGAWAKVQAMVQDALDGGATALVGGLSREPDEDGGHFFLPSVLTDVHPGMRCSQEEIFGPVLALTRFETEAEAVALANDTEFGLAAYLFSADMERLERVASQLHFGHVGLNTGVGPTPEAPFGGMWQSGLGREGGLEGILEFVELQTCPTPVR